jgi:hypothetical protein
MLDQDQSPQPIPNPGQFAEAQKTLRALRLAETERTAEVPSSSVLDLAEQWPWDTGTDPDYSAKTAELTEQFLGQYPNEKQTIVALTELTNFIRGVQRLDNPEPGDRHKDRKRIIKGLCEYQFLITSFAINNADDSEVMSEFWAAATKMARKAGGYDEYERTKAGVLPAVTTHKLFEILGLNPSLSRPFEDAFQSIDMWIGTGESSAVQIKRKFEDETTDEHVVIERTDTLTSPGVLAKGSDGEAKHYSPQSDSPEDVRKFTMKVDDYARQLGHPIQGYFIRIPASQIHPDTGMPSETLIEEVRTKLDQPAS